MVAGAEPKDLFVKDYYSNSADSDKRMRMFYVSEIINYQERIDENKSLNERRWHILNQTIWLVICTPVALVVSYIVAAWLI